MKLAESAFFKKIDETLEMAAFELNNENTHNTIKNALIKKFTLIFPNFGSKEADIKVFTTDYRDLCIYLGILDDDYFIEIKRRLRTASLEDIEEGLGNKYVIENYQEGEG